MRHVLAAATTATALLCSVAAAASAGAPAHALTTTTGSATTMSWSQVAVHGGGYVTGMVTGPSGQVYARTDVGGAYRWDEAARRWDQMMLHAAVPNPVGGDFFVESIAVAASDGQVVYVAVDGQQPGQGRILRSADGGRTWRDSSHRFAIQGNAEWRQGGERLSVDPVNPDVVTFGSRTQGLWRTEDGGSTWTRTTAPAGPGTRGAAGVMFTLFDTKSPVVGGKTQGAWAGVQNVGILRTDDAGRTWRVVHAIPNGVPRDAEQSSDGQLYVAVGGGTSQVVRVDSRAASSTVVTPSGGGSFATVAVDPTDPARVFLGDEGVRDGKLWRSANGGSTWTALNVAITGDADDTWVNQSDIEGWMSAGAMAFDPARPGRLWFAEGMGMWSTTDLSDSEVTWTFTSDGIEELVSNAAVKPVGKPLVTASWDRGLFRHPTPATGGAQLPYRGSFGSAWDVTSSPTDDSFLVAVLNDHQDASGNWYPARKASAFSTDGGATWTRFAGLANTTAPADMMFGNIAVSAGNNDNLVWVPSNHWTPKTYFTRDRGATWSAGTMVGAVAGDFLHPAHYLRRDILTADPLIPGTFYALGGNNSTGNGALWKTTDGGATWNKLPSTGFRPGYWDFRFNSHLVAVPGRSGHLFALTGPTDGGTTPYWRSTDGGATWQQSTSVLDAHSMGVGAPMTPGGNHALYTFGKAGTRTGLHRSTDLGVTWEYVSGYPLDWHQRVSVILGDPEVPGKVYIGLSGGGFTVGEVGSTTAPAPTAPAPTAPAPTAPAPAPTAPAPTATTTPAPTATTTPAPTAPAPSLPAPTQPAPSPIDERYTALGGAWSGLGHPTAPETVVAGGRMRTYEWGNIYWSASTGAWEVRGAILNKYVEGGGPAALGFPTNGEVAVPGGRAGHFSRSRIYWSAQLGAQTVQGAILTKYLEKGGPSILGLPTTSQSSASDGVGRFNHFANGWSIYWTPTHGATEVHGAIRGRWMELGAERSRLGYPTTDEYAVRGGTRSSFRGGTITWTASSGALKVQYS